MKVAFAELTTRSLKYILFRWKKESGYKYIHKLPQFFTTLYSRPNSSIDKWPNTVKKCDFMSVLYNKSLQEYKKPVFKTGNRVRISRYDLPFCKGDKPQFTREVFEIVAIETRKPPTYTIRDEQGEIIQSNFVRKDWIKSINNGFVYKRVGFKRFWRIVSKQYTQFFYKLFTRVSKHGGAMGGCNFRNTLPINVPKNNGGEFQVFLTRIFQNLRQPTI